MNRLQKSGPSLLTTTRKQNPLNGLDLFSSERITPLEFEQAVRIEEVTCPDGTRERVYRSADGYGILESTIAQAHACLLVNSGRFETVDEAMAAIPGTHRYTECADLGLVAMDGNRETKAHYARAPEPFGPHPWQGEQEKESYQPTGNTPIGFLKRGVRHEDILVGNGFLEVGSAALLVGPSGIGKSSIAMQAGCCWACGQAAFKLDVPRPMRMLMVQNEDSDNDLARQSALVDHLGLDRALIEQNFWIETVRGRVGRGAVDVIDQLGKWWKPDIILINPLSAYHSGDISQNRDNIAFLYSELGTLLAQKQFGLFEFHHKAKPPKNGKGKRDDTYFDVMYDTLGGSSLTNFHRGIITVSPIGNSDVFSFTLAKRFEESGWPLKTLWFKWHEDRSKRIWVSASVAEAEQAKSAGKQLADLRALVPITGTIAKEKLENDVVKAGFVRRDYRGLLAEALDETTIDEFRLYRWEIYNPAGRPAIAYSRFPQPDDETPAAIKAARKEKEKRRTRTQNV